MNLVLINLYPIGTISRYLLSSYVLKAYLEKHYTDEINISIVNYSTKHDNDRVVERVLAQNPDCVGYSCYGWNFDKAAEISKRIRLKRQSIVHIFGGPEISYRKVEDLDNQFVGEYYVIGEGERKLLNLINYVQKKQSEVPRGVIMPTDKGLIYEVDYEYISDLDEIPSVYLNGVLEDNLYERQQVFIETQRGCVFKCKYCVYHKGLPQVTTYSLQRIFDELDYLILEKQIQALRFCDSAFTMDLDRAKNIVKHLISLKEKTDNFPWVYWELMYFAVDDEFVELVSKLKDKVKIGNHEALAPKDSSQIYSGILAGYKAINCVGIQSFSNEVLKIVGRPPVRRKKLDWFMELHKRHNTVLKLDMILGLPGETFESYFEGLEYFVPYFEGTDHVMNIHRLRILPGSELEDLCDEHQIEYLPQDEGIVLSTQSMTEQEVSYASQLSALLFRVINSPFRASFFKLKRQKNITVFRLLENMIGSIKSDPTVKSSKLVTSTCVDDVYWNDKIFKEISSAWLVGFFEGGWHGLL